MNFEEVHILIVEDDPNDAFLIMRILREKNWSKTSSMSAMVRRPLITSMRKANIAAGMSSTFRRSSYST